MNVVGIEQANMNVPQIGKVEFYRGAAPPVQHWKDAQELIISRLFKEKKPPLNTGKMNHTAIPLEPARQNAIQNWWMKPEAGELLECLDKSRNVALIEACNLQAQAKADNGNTQFAAAAEEKLREAAEFETAIRVLKSFFPDGPFIARIEL